MKHVVSVVGARPNFMKVAPIHRAFAQFSDSIQHSIVHTGQHYDAKMSDVFFQELELPEPAVFLGVGSGSHGRQTGTIMIEFEKVLEELKPNLVLVVGDVNSTVACALTAVKQGIRVAHVEAGLRSHDRSMPEEINRMATDAICDYAFVTEQSGLDGLLREGWERERIFFVGNTMIDSMHFALTKVGNSTVLADLHVQTGEYVLVTLHRPSNVDYPEQLRAMLEILAELSERRKVVLPLHPRTRKNIAAFGLEDIARSAPNVVLCEPQSPVNFLALMKSADFVLTDSGGIQEETTALGVPCITMRTTTERPVTCTLGTNVLVAPEAQKLRAAIGAMLDAPRKNGSVPPFWDGRAAERIVDAIQKHCLG